jgi:hypothetical protein
VRLRYYVLWLVAMGLAEAGAAFDVSYHFGHVFDYFSIPHITVAVGVCLMVALLAWALVRERERVAGLERAALLVGAAALAVGILDEPLDLLYHLTFGVDITMWSPTHLMLNYPADVLNVCVVTALLASPAARGRGAWAIVFAIAFRNVLTTHFALYQQEYGAVALNALNTTGRAPWYVEPALWKLAGPRAAQLVTGGVPDWLYLLYFAFALSYALTLCAVVLQGRRGQRKKRRTDVWPWRFGTATALALCFVAWRLAFRGLFGAIHAAYGVIPFYVVPMGIAIDLTLAFGPQVTQRLLADRVVVLRPHLHLIVAGVAGVLAALALFGGMELMRAAHTPVPAAPLLALPFACLTGAAGAALGAWIATRVRELVSASRAVRATEPRRGRVPVLPRRVRVPALAAQRQRLVNAFSPRR